jgi:NAD(P)-dependent dehydrogenase (short-subunit alcohol dehydrogenase family)
LPRPRYNSIVQTALVTGASRGLGRATALAFAAAGWQVIATGRSADRLGELAAADVGGRVRTFEGDVASVDDNRRLCEWLLADGIQLDAVIHNAALLGRPRTALAEYPSAEFERVMAVNLFGPFDLTRRLLPHLAAGAAVIFVSSGASLGPRRGWGAYNVSKIALDGLAGVWALELSDRGIRVFVVDPGRLGTDMRAAAYPDEDPRRLPSPDEKAPKLVEIVTGVGIERSGERIDL